MQNVRIAITFHLFFRLCFTKLKLLLVAVVQPKESQEMNEVILNPGSKVVIDDETKGFFVCEAEDEVKR